MRCTYGAIATTADPNPLDIFTFMITIDTYDLAARSTTASEMIDTLLRSITTKDIA